MYEPFEDGSRIAIGTKVPCLACGGEYNGREGQPGRGYILGWKPRVDHVEQAHVRCSMCNGTGMSPLEEP